MSQATARSRGLRARRDLPAEARSAASEAISSTLKGLPGFATAHTVAGYWPTSHEVDLISLWRHLVASGVRVCLPRIGPPGTVSMDFLRWDPDVSMATNRYGIPEPSGPVTALDELDVVVLPCSAIDDAGTRVGMGAGFYDRALMPLSRTRSPRTGTFPEAAAPGPGGIRTESGGPRSDRALLIGVAFECQRVSSNTRITAADWDVGVDLVVTESAAIHTGGHK